MYRGAAGLFVLIFHDCDDRRFRKALDRLDGIFATCFGLVCFAGAEDAVGIAQELKEILIVLAPGDDKIVVRDPRFVRFDSVFRACRGSVIDTAQKFFAVRSEQFKVI